MTQDSLARTLEELAVTRPGVFRHVLVRLEESHRYAGPAWVARTLIPGILNASTRENAGHDLGLALAYAVESVGDPDYEVLEEVAFSRIRPGHPALSLSTALALHLVRDRDRYRSALDLIVDSGVAMPGPLLGLRALAARDPADLEATVARASAAYRTSPSDDLASVVGMSGTSLEQPWDLGEVLNTTGSLFGRYLGYLSAKTSLSASAPDALLTEVLAAVRSTTADHRCVTLLRFLSRIPSADVPTLLVEDLNRHVGDDVQLAGRAGVGAQPCS